MRVNHQKRRRIYINKLIEIIKSSEYQEYIEKDERYREFLESKALLKVWGFTILDTYGNKAMNKLIKGFSKLNKDRYQVDLSYRPKKIRDLNYFSLQYAGSSQSCLAKVKFLEDKFIREVDASFTQVNNN